MASWNGPGARALTATFTRPANTTAYAVGDLVANSATAASVVPLTWASTRSLVPFSVPSVKLEKSTTTVTDAIFRLHLFVSTIPTVATTGDNGVFASVVTGKGSWFASYEGDMRYGTFADGCACIMYPLAGVIQLGRVADVGDSIYGLLEARGAYAPGSAEIFIATLINEFPRSRP